MKITSLVSAGVLEFNDLGSVVKGVSPILRDVKLNAGQSKYLLETGEVLLSAQAGDIARYKAAGKISVNDRVAVGATLVAAHSFGIIPNVSVVVDPLGTPTAGVLGTDYTVTHNVGYTTTTVVNLAASVIDVRIG